MDDKLSTAKRGYLLELLNGKIAHPKLVEAIFIYWHSGIALEDARSYLKTLERSIEVDKMTSRRSIDRINYTRSNN